MRAQSFLPAFTFMMMGVILLTGCLEPKLVTPTQISELEYTQAVETLVAELTQSAPQATPSEIMKVHLSASPAVEILPATSTIAPTETLPPTSTPRPTDSPYPTDSPSPDFTVTPTSTPEPAWRLVFQDDLKSGNWITEKTDSFRLQYSTGGYMITNQIEKEIAYSVRNDPYSNVRLEVTAKRVSGPQDGYYGLICNFVNGSNYYFLGVGVDGWYGIGVKQSGQMRWLKEGNDQQGIIHKDDTANTLRAECAQSGLILWVNEVMLASSEDHTFTSGALGVGVGNRQQTGTEIVFSNFMVFELEEP